MTSYEARSALMLERENQAQVCGGVSVRYQMLSCAIDALASAPSPSAVQELEAAQKAVRDACTMCDGSGVVVGVASRAAHGCDGSEAMCARVCPVEEQYQTEEECEYCGRPIAAIQKLIDARLAHQEGK